MLTELLLLKTDYARQLFNMELIQDWSSENKQLLIDKIVDMLDGKAYVDIAVAGSRVHGGFHPKSDIDVIVYIDNNENTYDDRLAGYLETVPNPESEYGNFYINIRFEDSSKVSSNDWVSNCGIDYPTIYDLPKYSLTTNVKYDGNTNHIEHHKKFRKLMLDLNGLNLPFDTFWQDNLHLYE